MKKTRLDVRVVELGLAPSRQQAHGLIMSGQVLVNDEPAEKAGLPVSESDILRLRGERAPYVSRGGVKLAGALDAFGVAVEGRVGLDVGASTGGFTHVLLTRGATKVFAVDVGHSQLDWRIRSDARVIVIEKVNARYLEFAQIGTSVDIIVVDVSFISLTKILPALTQFATPKTDWVTLIKPQFEVGRENIGKGGIVESDELRQACVSRIQEFAETVGLQRLGLIESPLKGTDGNIEFLAHWRLAP